MKTTLIKVNSQKSWDLLELTGFGKTWSKSDKNRFYISQNILFNLGYKLKKKTISTSNVYIDMDTLEICDCDFEVLLDEHLNEIMKLLKENHGKEIFSTWTGRTTKCTDILHFIGTATK